MSWSWALLLLPFFHHLFWLGILSVKERELFDDAVSTYIHVICILNFVFLVVTCRRQVYASLVHRRVGNDHFYK